MEELTELLMDATAAVEPGYFHLNIDGGDPVYRERVYCYELYHQMRLRWPQGCPFSLNGEIDKAAHPILMQLGAAHAKPDLLIHQPGSMAGNYAIVEVKPSHAPNNGIRKDIAKLSLFRREVRYLRAIYLLHGARINDALIDRLRSAAALTERLAPIEVWIHPTPGRPATHEFTLGG